MSMLSSLIHKIMGTGAAQAAPAGASVPGSPATQASAPHPAASTATTPATTPITAASPGSAGAGNAAPPMSGAPVATNTAPPAGSGTATVDVAAVLNGMAAQKREKLDWKRSIVDLMKLLDMDSGLQARKELARELGYTGSTDDSATMNVWLHKQVMRKLAENGGRVPDELRS